MLISRRTNLTFSALSEPESESLVQRKGIRVCGVVQGVGFRPFVYRLATEENLAGFIGNDTDGVTIELEGPAARIRSFLTRLTAETPPLARIDTVATSDLALTGETGFSIVASEVLGRVSTGIPGDAATCADCLRELLDPGDRRYRYPFLNCTNCGPRYTITLRIPYDRPQTSMARFPMCPECQAEYDDPLNRRFHAQPNACWNCGPRVWLETPDGKPIESADPVAETIKRLLGGEVVAIKGIGGFHLSVDATSEEAVARLRQRKHRYGKPLAVMVRDILEARALCDLTPEEEALLQSPARPIVLGRARQHNGIAPSVAPGIPWLGIFLPYAPLQHLLFADLRVKALVMTSANLSEEPIAIDNGEARTRLATIADAFLMHDREILQRCDDSVAALVDARAQVIRRARGFVQLAVPLPLDAPPLLAVGGHLKNVLALARGKFVYQSQHIGDLENATSLQFFEECLHHLINTFEIEPQTVVHDLHPGYMSTGWARQLAGDRGLRLISVQHHHAHIAACMAEHALSGPVIGLALDGTGYGTDGHIWGGELLICRLSGRNPAGFERFAHLDYVPMPGGEAAIREPWRMAFGHLVFAGFTEEQARELVGATEQESRVMARMIERQINAPHTSSLGRLFDAAAAVILRRRKVDYEAQAAIELEGIAVDEADRLDRMDYVPELFDPGKDSNGPILLKVDKLWRAIVADLRRGVPAADIAVQFHAGVAEGFIAAAARARETTGVNDVAMSGGCMHNRRLTRFLRTRLEKEGFKVYLHSRVSPGDGGLSYGQAAVAAAILYSESTR
jgi:hydrogenase maturation protein HypF